MALRTYTCPHCGANMMIEIGKRKAVCDYCDSEIYIDEIISDIKRDRHRDDREDEKRNEYHGGSYSERTYDNRTQSQSYSQGYVNQANAPGVSPKSRMAALLLCIFLGVFGIHRFYVGKVGTGILYLFTCAIFGIGWIYDVIMIAIGSFRDGRGLTITNW